MTWKTLGSSPMNVKWGVLLHCDLHVNLCAHRISLYIYVYIYMYVYIYVVIFVLHSVGLATRGFLNFAFPKKSLTMHNIGVRINIALIFVCSPFRLCQLYLNGQLLSIQEAKEQWGAQDQSWTVEAQVLVSQRFCFHPSSAAQPRPLFPTFMASSWQSPTMSRTSMLSLVGKPRDGLLSFFPAYLGLRPLVYTGYILHNSWN